MSTSAIHRSENGRINVFESSEHPIILGDSLKNSASANIQHLRLRYNWEPRNGFSGQEGTLKRSKGQIQLTYQDGKSGSSIYDFSAVIPNDAENRSDKKMTQLALVFDVDKSAYVLEQISQSFDLNLTSAHDQSRAEVKRRRQVGESAGEDPGIQVNGNKAPEEHEEEDADPSNPFDFRHFLSEARENAEKAAQPTGSRTPIPGSRTPMSGVSSPSLGPSRFLSTTTAQFRPNVTSTPLPKKPTTTKPATSAASKRQTATKRRVPAAKPSSAQPLSSEVVSDSSDEDTRDTITVSQPVAQQAKDQGHQRNISSTSIGRSPHVMVDAGGGLLIDEGSPPPESRRRVMLDVDAFRSQTQTPTQMASNNRPQPSHSPQDIEMRDRSDEEDEEVDHSSREIDTHDDVDADMDEDVDVLDLDGVDSKKAYERQDEMERAPSPPTPLPPLPPDEDDDFENVLAEMLMQEDESEISEEE